MAATTVNAGDPGFSQACADATGKQSFHGYQCSNGMLFCYLEGSLGGVVNVQADDAYKQDFLKLGGAIADPNLAAAAARLLGVMPTVVFTRSAVAFSTPAANQIPSSADRLDLSPTAGTNSSPTRFLSTPDQVLRSTSFRTSMWSATLSVFIRLGCSLLEIEAATAES
jgi:hypothetical protein